MAEVEVAAFDQVGRGDLADDPGGKAKGVVESGEFGTFQIAERPSPFTRSKK